MSLISSLRKAWSGVRENPRTDMEWQMVRILIVFRIMHAVQLALAVPSALSAVPHRGLALLALAVLVGESLWFVSRVIRLKGYGGVVTAGVELGCATALLLSCSLFFPVGNRVAVAAPLLIVTTEQVTGAAVGSALDQLPRWALPVGTVTVAGGYTVLIGTGDPGALSSADVLIGISGYLALAFLIRKGAVFLLDLADRIAFLSGQVAELAQRQLVEMELHNYVDGVLHAFEATDADGLAARADHERLRQEAALARRRVRTYIESGRFDALTDFRNMIQRQIAFARLGGLKVAYAGAASVTASPVPLTGRQMTLLEQAIRAALLNVLRHSGVREAMLRAEVIGGPRRTARVLVTDWGGGRAGPPGDAGGDLLTVLRGDRGAGRSSLAGHRDALRAAGGDLGLVFEDGSTQVAITLPVGGDGPARGGRRQHNRTQGQESSRERRASA